MLALTAITAVQRFVKVWRQAQVAPVTAARIELRRSRRQSRRVARTRTAPHPRAATPFLTVAAPAGDAARARLQRLAGAVTYGAYRTASGIVRTLPNFAADGFAVPAGLGANLTRPERRAMIERQLRRVDPTLEGWRLRRAVQDAFDSYARYWIDTFRLPTLPARVVEDGFTTEGYNEHIEGGLAEGRGVILALPHLGGWEWAGRWLTDQGHPVTVIVEQLDPPELFDWFVRLRRDLGMTVVPLGPDAGRAVLKALADNEVVCLLCDRNIGAGGVEVEFFGERTTAALRPGDDGDAGGSAARPRRRLLHPTPERPSRRRRPAGADGTDGSVPRRRWAGHPGPHVRPRAPDPQGAVAVAHVPAQLAERSRIHGRHTARMKARSAWGTEALEAEPVDRVSDESQFQLAKCVRPRSIG